MTYAPERLLEVRRYLRPLTGLSDVELGIVGDAAHLGGYHHGWDQRRTAGDYSWSESPRDWNHKTNASRAFDLGWFDRVINGRRVTLIEFNRWVVAQAEAGAPDTRDLREIIYTPDGVTVRRWDRLRKRTTGDPSHLKHTHFDWFADAEHNDKVSLFRRFFEGEDDDTMKTVLVVANGGDGRVWLSNGITRIHVADHTDTDKAVGGETVLRDTRYVAGTVLGGLVNQAIQHVDDLDAFGAELPADLAERLAGLDAKVSALSSPTLSDEQLVKLADLVAARIPAPATPEQIAVAVLDEDHKRSES